MQDKNSKRDVKYTDWRTFISFVFGSVKHSFTLYKKNTVQFLYPVFNFLIFFFIKITIYLTIEYVVQSN